MSQYVTFSFENENTIFGSLMAHVYSLIFSYILGMPFHPQEEFKVAYKIPHYFKTPICIPIFSPQNNLWWRLGQ